MLNNKKIVIVLPAYNAAKTLERTYKEIPFDIVDDVVLVDDVSKDNTIEVANQLGIVTLTSRLNAVKKSSLKTTQSFAIKKTG